MQQKIVKTEIDDLEDLNFTLPPPPPKVKEGAKPLDKKHYVNNKELQEEFIKYSAMKEQWIADGKEGYPPLTDKIGKAILDISYRRTFSHNYIAYTNNWKEEMISDAIEICCRYAHNYNPHKYNNPFAYITTLVTNALINRIKTEKKQIYIKYKLFDSKGGYVAYNDSDEDAVEEINNTKMMYTDYLDYISDYEEKMKKPEKEEPLGILEFLGE